MTMIRMQARGLTNYASESVGSVLFADSFFKMDSDVNVNLTQNVPVI